MADETKLTAATRIEKLLDNIAGGDNEVTPATRLEKFLSYIADAMEGGGGSGGGIPNYLIKEIPAADIPDGYSSGTYIDGDPATICSGLFTATEVEGGRTRTPMFFEYNSNTGVGTVCFGEVPIESSRLNPMFYVCGTIGETFAYNDKLTRLVL